ncbi:MAG: hypothetical protein EBS16_03515 [Betaproteobacteria bacterium]|jgi:uncharacterized membrane protein YqjE|nr:hypothetical protein [Betaproteobacteria bacterium]
MPGESTLGAAARRVLAHLLAMGRTRLQLAAVELELERRRWVRMWLQAILVLFAAFMAIGLGIAWVLWRVDPQLRATVAGSLALFFGLLSAVGVWCLLRESASRRPWLESTLSTLSKDEDALADRPT